MARLAAGRGARDRDPLSVRIPVAVRITGYFILALTLLGLADLADSPGCDGCSVVAGVLGLIALGVVAILVVVVEHRLRDR